MAELLVTFTEPTRHTNGDLYWARALGRVADDGLWEAWLEFSLAGSDEVVTTARETEQPNRADLTYWAQGLSDVYLEGALARALRPAPVPVTREPEVHLDSAPRPAMRSAVGFGSRVVLDPFQVYAEGPELLRKQLHALSRDHLLNIIEAYQFAGDSNLQRETTDDALVERIMGGVRSRLKGSQNVGATDRADSADFRG